MKILVKSHGYDMDGSDESEILKTYEKICIQEIKTFQNIVFEQNFFETQSLRETAEFVALTNIIKEEIRQIQGSVEKLYEVLDRYIEKCPYEELKFLIFSGIKKIPFMILDRAFKIKYYQYQEIWLEKIEINLEILPLEERSVLMQYYQDHRENIPLLFKVYRQTFDPKEVQKMKEVAQNKLLLLQNFSPQLLEENYKAFFDESEQKIHLIKEILSYTHSYPKNYLKKIPINQLMILKEEIKKQKEQEERSKKRVAKYIKLLEESMMVINDGDFDMACSNAIKELDSEELQKVIGHLGSQNKFFANKFESVAKQLRGSVKAKFF